MGSYDWPPLEKLDVSGRLTLWIVFTPDPLLEHRVVLFRLALSHYASTLNESTNDRYPNSIGELNLKDWSNRLESLLSLSITS